MNEGEVISSKTTSDNIDSFLTYLKRLITVFFDANEDEESSSGLEETLQNNSNLDLVKKFIYDLSVKCLFITKKQGKKIK
jgi:hypothetical protein